MSWAFRQLPFWDRVAAQIEITEGGCHIFTGSKDDCGYGRIRNGKKLVRLHREVYLRDKGEIPLGAVVMHSCDVPACINPSHLSLGTQVENIHDMDKKGRRKILLGVAHGKAKLKDADIHIIRQRIESGETCNRIADDFSVSEGTIQHIKQGRNWSHVDGGSGHGS